MTTKNTYEIAPVSRQIFTMTQFERSTTPPHKIMKTGSAQNINLETLNEKGLHRALFILTTRIDPQKLGTAEDEWRNLPKSRTVELDESLRRAFPENVLRTKLQDFMEIWASETIEKRSLGAIKVDKFKHVPAWPALHTVKPLSVAESQLVMTQRGVQIQPEQCVAKLGELRARINQLADALASCNDTACYELQRDNIARFRQTELQSKCLTPLQTI